MGSEGLHEPAELLDEATIDRHRALTSLIEELEAVDWYDQRVKATNDSGLADVLAHNRDEEKEHASMTLEWLRRRDPVLDRHLRTYLFTSRAGDRSRGRGGGGRRCRRRVAGLARHREPEGNRVMDHLYRDLAPISEAAWCQIEDEAKGRLVTHLAARKLVDLDGPHGWDYSATDLGRVDEVDSPSEGVRALRRRVLPLVELRAEFAVSREELDDADRGAGDIELPELDEAVRQIALAENTTVFHGYAAGGILGITEESSHYPISIEADMEQYPKVVAQATDVLRQRRDRRPLRARHRPRHLHRHRGDGRARWLSSCSTTCARSSGGPVVWAPGVEGGVVLSQRGGDFVFHLGQDLSIGYRNHDAEVVRLYVEESFSFRVSEADAAVALTRG